MPRQMTTSSSTMDAMTITTHFFDNCDDACMLRKREDALAVHYPFAVRREAGIELMHVAAARNHERHG